MDPGLRDRPSAVGPVGPVGARGRGAVGAAVRLGVALTFAGRE